MSASDIHDRAHVETDRPAGSLHPTARFHGRKRTGIQPTNHRATDSLGRQPKPRSTHEGRLPTIDQGPPMPTELRRACNGGVDGNRTQRTSCFVVPSRAVKCRLSRANAACWCCPVSPGDGYAATFCQHGSARLSCAHAGRGVRHGRDCVAAASAPDPRRSAFRAMYRVRYIG